MGTAHITLFKDGHLFKAKKNKIEMTKRNKYRYPRKLQCSINTTQQIKSS